MLALIINATIAVVWKAITLLMTFNEYLVAQQVKRALTVGGFDLSDVPLHQVVGAMRSIQEDLKQLTDSDIHARIRQHHAIACDWPDIIGG